jgi:hypothetical protein
MNRRAFALGVAMIVLANVAAVGLRAYAESVFLASYGTARLPWLLIANAGGFAAATLGYHAATRGIGTRVADFGLLAAVAAVTAAAPALLDASTGAVIVVLGLAAAAQVAGLALWNRTAAAVAGRDARRLLPRAGAAMTAGGVVAGLGAGALVSRAGLNAVAIAAAVFTALALVVGVVQDRALAGTAQGGAGSAEPRAALPELHVALLRALVAVAVLEAAVSTIVDLQFNAALKDRYDDAVRPIAIALFLAGTNAVLLALQVAAIPRLLVTRSLPFTATIHPAIVGAGYAAIAAVTGFVPIATTRTADQVLRAATSRTSQELALSALAPGPRARWKVLLRGVAWPAGAGATALGLLALGSSALADTTALAGAAIAIAVAWTIGARAAARRFQTALAAPLGIATARRDDRRDDPRRIDMATLERWTAVAGGDDARAGALARAALATARVDTGGLADHLRHDDPAVRAAMFEQLARAPVAAIVSELRAAAAIEDDDRALARAIDALAAAGDPAAIDCGNARAMPSREVADATRAATLALRGGDVLGALPALCRDGGARAAAVLRARRGEVDPGAVRAVLRGLADEPANRVGALATIARLGDADALVTLADALVVGDAAAHRAIADLDGDGAAALAPQLAGLPPLAKLAIARALAGAPTASAVVAALIGDPDPEVAHAALRTALAIGRGGAALPVAAVVAAREVALAALIAHLDARDASAAWGACATGELAIATARCAARLMWACAVVAACEGRDPAPLAATARHLAGGGDADRRRALDVAQELDAGRGAVLAALERWTQPPRGAADGDGSAAAIAGLGRHDPWLAALAAGEHAAVEPALVALRRAPLFAAVAGAALAALAAAATPRRIEGVVFRRGDHDDAVYVVVAGAVIAQRPDAPPRHVDAGGVIGELAMLSASERAATAETAPGGAELIAIDRASFAAAARRAPELVLGIAASLATWLAPNRPDAL